MFIQKKLRKTELFAQRNKEKVRSRGTARKAVQNKFNKKQENSLQARRNGADSTKVRQTVATQQKIKEFEKSHIDIPNKFGVPETPQGFWGRGATECKF